MSSSCAAALILWGTIDPLTTDVPSLNEWWTKEHLPERLYLPGFLRARRYRALPSSSTNTDKNDINYLALYEVGELQDLASSEYVQKLNNPTKRTRQFMPALAGMTRKACHVIGLGDVSEWDGEGAKKAANFLVLIVQPTLPGLEDVKQGRLVDSLIDALQKNRSDKCKECEVMSVRILRPDAKVTQVGSSSKSYDGVGFAKCQDEGGTLFALLEISMTPPWEPIVCLKPYLDHIVSSLHEMPNNEGLDRAHWDIYELIADLNRDEKITS
ncbi:hypothetical protein N0V90_010769 [Kalmusia sp. IMI 367209]|nr:hypothetical protein N0V90_010769 [Kalmusia sp. IMI 367209]